MKYNYETKRIEMTKAEAKLASVYNSDEFKSLMEMKNAFPEFTVYVLPKKVIKKNENKESYRGLTYAYMESYIATHADETVMKEYREQRLLSSCHSVRYPHIKRWFLERFPEIAAFGMESAINSAS